VGSRFVVQEHTTPEGVHWDLMIEKGEALTTFRLAEHPENARRCPVEAVRIFDHALRFLTYEGPVQKGAGSVRIVERGECSVCDEQETAIALDLHGTVLQGRFNLARTEEPCWRLERVG
jgi:hypothetical protein